MATTPSLASENRGLVSVVIAAYNGEKYIRETLDSVGAQTHPHWEIVVVEDGSHDGTERIVKEFAKRHPGHRVHFERSVKNCGLGHTRNLTFAKARGEFVAILDSDDCWLPHFLATSVEALNASGKDIAYSSTVMIEDGTNLLLGVWGPTHQEIAAFPQSLFGRSFLTPSATLIRRQALAEVGPWDDFRYAEDYSYWLRCAAAGKQFVHIGGCHCLYRKNHAGAMTRSLSGTIEGVADVAARFLFIPGVNSKQGRRCVAQSYASAAYLHSKSDPRWDPSANPSRAPGLFWKAWRLDPRSPQYLFKAVVLEVKLRLRGQRFPTPVEASASDAPERAAA